MLITKVVCADTSTTPSMPQKITFTLPRGVIVRVLIRIPPGPCGLAGLRVFKGIKQIIPFNEGEWIIGDDDRIEFEMYHEIKEEEEEFIAEVYNFDAVYRHCFYLYFNILQRELALAYRVSYKTLSILESLYRLMTGRRRRR